MTEAIILITNNQADALIDLLQQSKAPDLKKLLGKIYVAKQLNFSKKYTPDGLMEKVAELTGFSRYQITGGQRKRELVEVRTSISAIMYDLFRDMTFKEIGYYIGCDHSTVSHNLRKSKEVVEFKRHYIELKRQLEI